MRKIGIVGDEESVRGFAAVGFSVFPVPDAKEASRTVKHLSDGGYTVIYVVEDLFSPSETTAGNAVVPIVIPIPGVRGTTGAGMERLRQMAIRAIGSDMAFEGESDDE